MTTPTVLFPLLGLLLSWQGTQCLVPPNKLQQMSTRGSKYIDAEVESAINGIKEMKVLMDKTSQDHQRILTALEDTRRKKEEALLLAKETEQQLSTKEEVCNDTMLALWEECKPCLKQTCMRFYSRTCHSGAGLVGRQLEEFLNRSSPFSVWINGERVDTLMDEDEEQGWRLEDLEERYGLVDDLVDDLFQKSTQAYGRSSSFFRSPFSGFWEPLRDRNHRLPLTITRLARAAPSFFLTQPHHHDDLHQFFQRVFEMSRRAVEGVQKDLEWTQQWPREEGQGSFWGRFPTETRNSSDDRMVCREIRRNSAGCLKMKDKCEKCQAIVDVDCSQTDPGQSLLRERFEDALRVAERFTRQYDDLLRSFQEEMFNTSSHLDTLNSQFGWVSRLANLTRNLSEKPLQVTTVVSKSSNAADPSKTEGTEVTVRLFDLEPISLSVPSDIPLNDTKFMEVVAEKALRRYKANEVL